MFLLYQLILIFVFEIHLVLIDSSFVQVLIKSMWGWNPCLSTYQTILAKLTGVKIKKNQIRNCNKAMGALLKKEVPPLL